MQALVIIILTMFERCLYFNLNALTRKVNRIWEAELRKTGLSTPHAYVMQLVLNSPGISQKQLAEELHLDPSTITRFVNALEERHLVHRTINNIDRRSATVAPTAEGEKLQKELNKIGHDLFRSMQTKLGDKDFRALITALREARNMLEAS